MWGVRTVTATNTGTALESEIDRVYCRLNENGSSSCATDSHTWRSSGMDAMIDTANGMRLDPTRVGWFAVLPATFARPDNKHPEMPWSWQWECTCDTAWTMISSGNTVTASSSRNRDILSTGNNASMAV